jgi:hypothetical protein
MGQVTAREPLEEANMGLRAIVFYLLAFVFTFLLGGIQRGAALPQDQDGIVEGAQWASRTWAVSVTRVGPTRTTTRQV